MDKTISENYINIKAVIVALEQDYEKFENKKVKVAGARVRNNLLNIKKLCDILRKQVLSQIKELPIKHRTKSSDDEDSKSDEDSSSSSLSSTNGEIKEETKEETKEEETSSSETNKEIKEEETKEVIKPKRKRRANKVKVIKV
jgi:hypothetical protein